MIGVITGQRADAVRAEELVLVEHLLQHAAKPGFVEDGGEAAAGDAGFPRVVDIGHQLRTGGDKVAETLTELGILCHQGAIENSGRTQGQEADHGSNLEPLRLAVGQAEHVVEEAILFIPHAGALAHLGHRRRDP